MRKKGLRQSPSSKTKTTPPKQVEFKIIHVGRRVSIVYNNPKSQEGPNKERILDILSQTKAGRLERADPYVKALNTFLENMKKFKRLVFLIVPTGLVVGVIQSCVPGDEWYERGRVSSVDADKLIKGFNANSENLSKKYPGRVTWLLEKNGTAMIHDTTIYIPVSGGDKPLLKCASESFTDDLLGDGHNFECELVEEPNIVNVK